jgi:hypothetical protein
MKIARKRTKPPTEAQELQIRSLAGTVTDRALAAIVGTSFAHARRIRIEMGVEACYSKNNLWQYKPLMGKYPDIEVAKLAKVSRQRIHQYRVKHEIPAPPSSSEFIQGLMRQEMERVGYDPTET